jgi:hypothetical protein
LPAAILKCIGHYGLDVSWTCPISGWNLDLSRDGGYMILIIIKRQ